MCYKVLCRQCGKNSWGGCGNHLKTLYSSIDKGNHCMCRSWPGVVIPKEEEASTTETDAKASGNSAAGSASSGSSGSCSIA